MGVFFFFSPSPLVRVRGVEDQSEQLYTELSLRSRLDEAESLGLSRYRQFGCPPWTCLKVMSLASDLAHY